MPDDNGYQFHTNNVTSSCSLRPSHIRLERIAHFRFFLFSSAPPPNWRSLRPWFIYFWDWRTEEPAGTSMKNDICSLIAPTPGHVPQVSPQEGYKLCYRDMWGTSGSNRHVILLPECLSGPNISSKIWRKCPIENQWTGTKSGQSRRSTSDKLITDTTWDRKVCLLVPKHDIFRRLWNNEDFCGRRTILRSLIFRFSVMWLRNEVEVKHNRAFVIRPMGSKHKNVLDKSLDDCGVSDFSFSGLHASVIFFV